jgi:hypothetical protein
MCHLVNDWLLKDARFSSLMELPSLFPRSALESRTSEQTLNSDSMRFSGKVISVTEFQSTPALKRIFTPKKNECGVKTRKTIVNLEIHSNSVKEVLDGQIVASMDLSTLQFGLIPSKQGKRFQFALQGLHDGEKIKREYEVQNASELAIWFSQLNPEHPQPTGQLEQFWLEFAELIGLVRTSFREVRLEYEESERRLRGLLEQLEMYHNE